MTTTAGATATASAKKPNILVIWGDDIGVHNISAYNHGIMGYKTPNIDRLAREGAMFTDFYGQQSCTAGRASFILGQHPFRTGLLTIGMPGSRHGIPDWTPTIADLLKQQGYATGQFGKNHLGDNNNHLPTVHGFDEFFGNLYHLKPGTIMNEIMSLEDWMPTLLAAAGEPDIVDKLKQGYQAGGKTFKMHADGSNFLPFFKGEVKKSPRDSIYYFGQGGELNAVRWNDWKVNFAVQTGNIATGVRSVPGWPAIVHLRADPYERAVLDSQMYMRWYADNLWLFVPVQEKIKEFLATIPSFPFQEGSSLNAAGINYQTLKAAAALKRLHELESLSAPNN